MAKFNAMSWNIDVTSTQVVAAMSFTDFEQSQRFVEMLIKFIQAERKPPEIRSGV